MSFAISTPAAVSAAMSLAAQHAVSARAGNGEQATSRPMKPRFKSKSEIYELFMLGLCVYVLIALAATTFLRLDDDVVEILDFVDAGICFVFMADFFMKLYMAENKLHYLKWGWIDFISSIPAIGPLRWGRFGRVVRILRLLRGVRSVKILVEFLLRRRAESAFGTVVLISMLLVVFSSVAILMFERDIPDANIRTSEDALWWACATVTGVGYGDRYPITSSGRSVAALTMGAGLALYATMAGFVASWFLSPQEEEQEVELEAIRDRLISIEELLQRSEAREEQQLKVILELSKKLPVEERAAIVEQSTSAFGE